MYRVLFITKGIYIGEQYISRERAQVYIDEYIRRSYTYDRAIFNTSEFEIIKEDINGDTK